MAREAERARRGLELAQARLREAVRDGVFEDWSIALVEVLAWTRGIHEWPVLHSPDYMASVDPATNNLLDGIKWARNRGVHQLAATSDAITGLSFPLTFPIAFAPRWLASTAITPGNPDKSGLAGYEARCTEPWSSMLCLDGVHTERE